MTVAGWLQIAVFSLVVLALTRPLGLYLYRVFEGTRRPFPRIFGPVERLLARLSGNGEFRILLAHILPNIMPIMIVQMSLTMGYAILNAAGLSFIGLGVRPPDAEWGIMVAEGAAFMVSGEWWIAFFPGAALMIAVFCFNLLGDGLRDIVDPQRRT